VDLIALSQALGLALSVGVLIGAVVPPVMPAWGVAAGAAPLGAVVALASLNAEDEAVWPALPIGILAAGFAAIVIAEVAGGAARRERGAEQVAAQPAAGVSAILIGSAALLAALTLFVPPVALVALAALAWIWGSRRRRAQAKHEGLRVLR